jgi:hypothetical protein
MRRIDPDHDGWTNLEEFLSGTNPRVADTTYLRVRRGGLQTAIAGQVLPEPIVVQAIREVVGAGGLRLGFTALADEEVSFSGPADMIFIQEGDEPSPGANPLTLRTDEAGYANVRAQAPSQAGRHTIYVRLGNGREAALSLEVQPAETGGIPGGGGPGDGPGSPPPNPEFTLQWQHVWRSASVQGSNSTGGFSNHRTQQKAAAPGVQPQRAGAEAGYPSMSSPAGHYGHNDSNHAQRDPQRVETWRILYDPAWREYGSSDFGNVYVQDWHKSAPPVNAESILAIPFESFSPVLWTHAREEHVLGLSRSNVGPWIEGEENGETIREREITASTTQHRARLVAMKDGQPVVLPQGTTLALLVMETVTQFDAEGGAGMATETRVRKTLQMVIPPGGSTSPPIETEDLMSPAAPNTEKLLRLLPVEIEEVFERDQKWNKIPNPKNPPSYSNLIKIPADLIRYNLFVATEPSSGKVELTVKTAGGGGGSGVKLLCGLRDTSASSSGPILSDCVPVDPSGLTQLDFTPTGSVHDKAYRVVIGVDKNSDNSLSADEVVTDTASTTKGFVIRAVRQADYQASLDYLDRRDNAFWYPVAQDFLGYFDGNNTTIDEATSMAPITVPITATDNPTHIAGSTYNPSNGETSIPRFKLPEGSTASNKMEDTLDRDDSVGLRSVVQNIWNANVTSFAAPFNANPSLQTSTSAPLTIAQGTTISFYEPDPNTRTDLKLAYGGANIEGTVVFGLKRDPSNSLKVILDSVTVNAVVKDMYDFDWTRDRTWPSREAATVQIGHDPPDRKGGKIFATETEVQRLYTNDGAISKFNASWWITLPNPSPGTPITPPGETE